MCCEDGLHCWRKASSDIPMAVWDYGPEAWQILSAEAPRPDFIGSSPLLMVLDTACQKSCHGSKFGEHMSLDLQAFWVTRIFIGFS